jgi:lipid II:glycine glycyltransferase (peptidoglycan interpeptide bridge formation enzyme)
VLVRAVPLLGWRLGYAPRGPIGQLDDPTLRSALLAALRDLGRSERVATLKVDPEAVADDPLGLALRSAPWRRAAKVQPPRTRLIDLAPDEETLIGQMSKKHRQYVHKADREGVTVTQLSPTATPNETAAALADFYRIYADTAERAGFVARVQDYYERVWSLFGLAGHARLFFAVLGGERVATLFHFTCGDRAAEAYGGMTDAGADSRANYLLKWEAIRAFRAEGFTSYDLWGIATGGIRHFKEGFGGRQVDYTGAHDLPLRPVQDAALRVLLPAYGIAQRARLRLTGHRLAGSDD